MDFDLNYKTKRMANNFPFNKIRPSSFEQQENENREYSQNMSGAERLAYLKLLILNSYGKGILTRMQLGKKITIRK